MSITGVAPPVDVIRFVVPKTLVTVPVVGVAQLGTPAANVKTWPSAPGVTTENAFIFLANNTALFVRPLFVPMAENDGLDPLPFPLKTCPTIAVPILDIKPQYIS